MRSENRVTRVVLADDHALFREALRCLLATVSAGEALVVGEAGDVVEAGRVVRALRPDVLVMDLRMPGGQPVDLIRELTQDLPSLRILVLTMHDDAAYLRAVLAAGAHGYLLKHSTASALAEAVSAVANRQLYIDAALRPAVQARPPTSGGSAFDLLTSREREVFALLARGLTYAEAGRRLHIGVRTVESHRRKLAEKLGLETRADILRFALEFGLIRPGDVAEYGT